MTETENELQKRLETQQQRVEMFTLLLDYIKRVTTEGTAITSENYASLVSEVFNNIKFLLN